MSRRLLPLLGLALLCAAPAAACAETGTAPGSGDAGSGLPYPPQRPPQPDEIVHVPTGLKMSFDGMMDMVAGARLVCVGESHDSLRAHQVQLQVIRELERRFPGRVALGMEMFRQAQQQVLDRWTRGELGELDFLEATDWHNTWSMDFGYYRPILEFARERHIDVVALNPPQELQDAVRRSGIEALPDDLRRRLPEIGVPDPYQQALLQAVYGGHLPTPGAFDAFFRVQLLWEESMAESIVAYLQSARGAGKVMVALTGTGHVEYGLGVPKKVLRRMPLPYVIIAPTEIEMPPGKQMPDVELPDIPLLPADFVWWIPYEDLEASAVHLGVGVGQRGGVLVVGSVAEDSPAARAGILAGDEITSFAGHPVTSATALVYWIGRQAKGTAATVGIRRAGRLLEVRVEFQPGTGPAE
jgi:uncharacterized iron-regulated protein